MIREGDFESRTLERLSTRDALEFVIADRKFNRDHVLRSCCFQLDRRVVLFVIQFLISFTALLFSFIQLWINARHETCESTTLYSSIITLVIGFWLPQPKTS